MKFLIKPILAIIFFGFSISPASAEEFSGDGSLLISGDSGGGAVWWFDEYGLAYGGRGDDLQAEYIYYPNYLINSDDRTPFLCGSTDGLDSVITEDGEDLIVDCQPRENNIETGLTTTLHYRLYGENDYGYLARQWLEIENTTDSEIQIPPTYLQYYWNYRAWVRADNDPWITSQGSAYEANGDVWGVGGDTNGDEIATTSAWGIECQKNLFLGEAATYTFPEAVQNISAGQTVNLVTFFNMVFPETLDSSGAEDAYNLAISQAQTEYGAGLTGRLARGFPVGFSALGWDNSNCEVPSPTIANGYRADELGSVYFAPGSSKLSNAAKAQIKSTVEKNPSAIYKVTGYVQKSASSRNDHKLSVARARAVENYLSELGANVTFTVVIESGLVPSQDGTTSKARKATLFAMTPVVL